MNDEKFCITTPELGLVCITHGDEVRFKALTRKRLLQFDEARQREMLRELYNENLTRLGKAVEYLAANNIKLYRLSSALFPFADEPFGLGVLHEFEAKLRATGDLAISKSIRFVVHPDQYVVLSSDSEIVIENSFKILRMHANILDLLNQPRSEWATMNVHGGKANRSDKLVESIALLPDEIRSRIALENDEYAYSASEIYEVCKRANVRMVFDAHHHVVQKGLESYDDESVAEMFWAARETWENPDFQLVHISNGRERFTDRSHSDVIWDMPPVFRNANWIEIEAKHKEIAINRLRDNWLASIKG
ncbi:MAG: UV DNA damage repair endonuclease UvsE [Pyrinomonadaceae bacterium]|nr:UV DNA damage repair endonuclease UvsE [Pyrinomonadaceae bacterium]